MAAHSELTPQFVTIQEEMETPHSRILSWLVRKPYKAAMIGDWDKVIQFFNEHSDDLVKTTATGSRDTLLHLAMHNKKEEQLKQLFQHSRDLVFELQNIKNVYGNTLLHEAAIAGNMKAAELLVEKCQNLLIERNKFGETPLFRAASFGQNEMVSFLAEKTKAIMASDNQRDPRIRDDKTSVLHAAVRGGHYETALLLLKLDKSLVDLKDPKSNTAFHLLAETPSAFKSGCSMGLLKKFLYQCLVVEEEDDDYDYDDYDFEKTPEDIESGGIGKQSSLSGGFLRNDCKGLKGFYLSLIQRLCKGWPWLNDFWQTKRKHAFALRLAKKLIKKDDVSWDQSVDVSIDETGFYLIKAISYAQDREEDAGKGDGEENTHIDDMKNKVFKVALNESNDHEAPLLIATRCGIKEIVVEILKEYPQAVELINKSGQNILHLAIRHRQAEIFDIVNDMGYTLRQRLTQGIDVHGCNLLHYVADTKYYVGGKRAGPALELQEELKWFERVERIIPSYYAMIRDKQNELTAKDLFQLTHKEQLKNAITWIKETSQSCSTVSALVATVVFAAAYTVPGGYDSGGIPVFLHSPYFMFFAIMDVISLACSLTAVVMFLSVLTSTFELWEFRHSLPRKLTFGLTLLFVSVLTTMLAFGATILLTINLEKKWTTSLISVAAFVPVSVFALMQFHLYISFLGAIMDFWNEIKNALPLRRVRKPRWNWS